MNYTNFYNKLKKTRLKQLAEVLPDLVDKNLFNSSDGNLPKLKSILNSLPDIKVSKVDLNKDAVFVGAKDDCDDKVRKKLKEQFKKLHPWRKGPYNLFDIYIDTEWRSDWKWNRVKDHIKSLKNKLVLDVGCGNGYHCWRMKGAGAKLVMGIDPMLHYIAQYWAFQRYIQDDSVAVLPLRLEEIFGQKALFDTVFSMGVLYHAKSPMDHLQQLKSLLKKDGQIILETLVIDGKKGDVLVPEGRYAKMRNVWFIPASDTLISWLKRVGFKDIKLIDVCKTTIEEQRVTEWLSYESLEDFLDPDDDNYTVEGYPAPKRAIFLVN